MKDPEENISSLKSLSTQVGGHTFAHGKYENQKLGMLDAGGGYVLKSLQSPPRGNRELNFYQTVFEPSAPEILVEARQFVPKFYGTYVKDSAKYIKLENLTSKFAEPCVADLKMGRVTHDCEATPEKIASEARKFPPLINLGFQITGFMTYDSNTKEYFDKMYCRKLNEETIVTDGLGRFFGLHAGNLRRDLIFSLLRKLNILERWFTRQKRFSFIASSLLIVYEGSKLADNNKSNSLTLRNSCSVEDGSIDYYPKNKAEIANILTNKQTLVLQKQISSLDTAADHLISNNNEKSVQEDLHNSSQSSDFKCVYIENKSETGLKRDALKQVCETSSIKLSDVVDGKVNKDEDSITLHLIDFAHAFPSSEVDTNVLFGIRKLTESLEKLLNMNK